MQHCGMLHGKFASAHATTCIRAGDHGHRTGAGKFAHAQVDYGSGFGRLSGLSWAPGLASQPREVRHKGGTKRGTVNSPEEIYV